MNNKQLIISVGTGFGDSGSKSLARGIAFSIKNQRPDLTVFICSKESKKITIPLILKETGRIKHKTKMLSDTDDINIIFSETMDLILKLGGKKKNISNITVDYTSGTKAMSAGIAMAAVVSGIKSLTYVSGKREKGIVVQGTERLVLIQPYHYIAKNQIDKIKYLFNINQFEACLNIIDDLQNRVSESKINEELQYYKNISLAYSYWDKFDHNSAFNELKQLNRTIKDRDIRKLFSSNIEFLNNINKSDEPEYYYIADIINNAKRRAAESKYDDAVARLYRVLELIAQYRSKKEYSINMSNVIKSKVDKKWNPIIEKTRGRFGLRLAWELLKDKGDKLAEIICENKMLNNLLTKRNQSILAHGLSPVNANTFDKFYKILLKLLKKFYPDILKEIKKSEFVKL